MRETIVGSSEATRVLACVVRASLFLDMDTPEFTSCPPSTDVSHMQYASSLTQPQAITFVPAVAAQPPIVAGGDNVTGVRLSSGSPVWIPTPPLPLYAGTSPGRVAIPPTPQFFQSVNFSAQPRMMMYLLPHPSAPALPVMQPSPSTINTSPLGDEMNGFLPEDDEDALPAANILQSSFRTASIPAHRKAPPSTPGEQREVERESRSPRHQSPHAESPGSEVYHSGREPRLSRHRSTDYAGAMSASGGVSTARAPTSTSPAAPTTAAYPTSGNDAVSTATPRDGQDAGMLASSKAGDGDDTEVEQGTTSPGDVHPDEPASQASHAWMHRTRARYTAAQTAELENLYKVNSYPSMQLRKHLAAQFDVKEKSVRIWFQNKRAREKTGGVKM